jgi:hypothetical protein
MFKFTGHDFCIFANVAGYMPSRNSCLRFIATNIAYEDMKTAVALAKAATASLSSYLCHSFNLGGTRQHSWLKHYATSGNAVGSVPDDAIGFFNLPNPSSRTRAMRSTQHITEVSTMNIPGG